MHNYLGSHAHESFCYLYFVCSLKISTYRTGLGKVLLLVLLCLGKYELLVISGQNIALNKI